MAKEVGEEAKQLGIGFVIFTVFRRFAPSAQYSMQPVAYDVPRSRARRRPSSW
jgi:hypothetical protein